MAIEADSEKNTVGDIPLDSPQGKLLDRLFDLSAFNDLKITLGRRDMTFFCREPSSGERFRRITHTAPFPGIMTEPPEDTIKRFPNPIRSEDGRDWVSLRDFFTGLVGSKKEASVLHPTLFSPTSQLLFKISMPNRRVVFISFEAMIVQSATGEKPKGTSILDLGRSLVTSIRDRFNRLIGATPLPTSG